MIKADKESVKISGDLTEIMDQFVAIAKGVREVLENAFGGMLASKATNAIYELSKFTDEELETRQGEEIAETILKNLQREDN